MHRTFILPKHYDSLYNQIIAGLKFPERKHQQTIPAYSRNKLT